ncbi:MAG: YfiR/HmsC family protein [Cognaticolwellia sp.]
MKAMFARLRSSFMLVIVSMGLVVGGQTWAQTSTLDYEKAVLVSKFAKYVTWPAEARQSKFIIGVYEDEEQYKFFSDFFANKGVKGKDIEIRSVKTLNDAQNVNIIYVPSSDQRDFLAIADKVIGTSRVLIITEEMEALSKTMIDISYNNEQSKISFKVNDSNIDPEKINVPELTYFLDDKDNGDILSVSPTFARENKQAKQLLALQNQLAQQQSLLSQLNEKLDASNENSARYNLGLQQKTKSLEVAQQESEKKSQEIKAQEKKLQLLAKQVQAQQKQLKISKKLQAAKSELAGDQQAGQMSDEERIKFEEAALAQETVVADLTEQVKKQKELANNAAIKLANMAKEKDSSSSYQILFFVFLLIAIIALVIAFLMWKKAKDIASQPVVIPESGNNELLTVRENQLIKSENFAALGYVATDITYAAGLSLSDLQTQLESAGDATHAATLKPVVTLLENFNIVAADQDDTDIQSFDIISYMQKMMMLYDFEFNQSDIVYNYSGEKELKIKSVPSYVALVLLNIVNNSIKHGFDNNGNGTIALKVEKGAKGGAKVTYSDDGKGMTKATLDKIFEPFFTTQTERGYVGVGMSTTYDLVKNKLAGDIKVDSQSGKGTTVTITLP